MACRKDENVLEEECVQFCKLWINRKQMKTMNVFGRFDILCKQIGFRGTKALFTDSESTLCKGELNMTTKPDVLVKHDVNTFKNL